MSTKTTLHFIRNYTLEPIGNSIIELAHGFGLTITTAYGSYDNIGAEVAKIASFADPPPLIVVSIHLDYFAGGVYSPRWDLQQTINEFENILAAIDAISAKSFILISNFIPPCTLHLPLAQGSGVLGRDAVASELNLILRQFVMQRTSHCGLLDFERISARLGEHATHDRRFDLMAKSPYKTEFVEAAANEVMRFIKCRFLPPKKVLILDCDNTLWGGIVGEAGMENIQLDPYDYPGNAYYRFQSEVLAIAEKGFLICLCSKNDEAQVLEVLDKHAHSLIRRKHLAGYRINWTDKATNIKNLAQELNLSTDSMVFVDDNPVECELIRSQFPEVTVIQVPSKIYEYPGTLSRSDLFDRISINQEDKVRAQYYQAEIGRRELHNRHMDVQGFLRDLEMKAVVKSLGRGDLARASQLCQRTNQFNLTSRRHTESDLACFSDDPNIKVFILEAEDRFGPMGQSGLVIFRKSDNWIEVDSFLLSCRIIGRSFDKALFCQSLEMLRHVWNIGEIRAFYVATTKNGLVAGLWEEYGFSKVDGKSAEQYTCNLNSLKISNPDFIQTIKHYE